MNIPPLHYRNINSFKNKTLDWFPSDTDERLKETVQTPKFRDYLQNLGWDQPGSITYKFNSDAFRSEEFDSAADNVVALGCSFTMGVGLPIQSVWPSLLGHALNLQVCNLGWGGFSADACFRVAEYWIPYLNPKLVVFLVPGVARLEIIVDEKTGDTVDLMPGTFERYPHLNEFIKHWFGKEENSRLNNKKNQLAVEAICHQLNIPILCYESYSEMRRSHQLDAARDLLHAGPDTHKKFTEKILNDYTKKFRNSTGQSTAP
jgi:hypothetical protein